MMRSFRFGFLAAATLVACSIGLDQAGTSTGQDQECLELFETCVDLAGESPGCTEVFEFCQGTAAPTGTGGGALPGGCEQDYIDCLVDGSTADQCQPLLDACMPSGSTTGCDTIDPACTGGETSTVTTEPPPSCGEDGEPCGPVGDDCDERYDLCQQIFADGAKGTCESLRSACEADDCESALNICVRSLGSADSCEELTGCSVVPPDLSCGEILDGCAAEGLGSSECAQMYPERPECFRGDPTDCPWYQRECQGAFDPSVCADGEQACQVGLLPDIFQCEEFLNEACDAAQLSESACAQAQVSCEEGFFDLDLCSETQLYEDPYAWLAQLAECNEWE